MNNLENRWKKALRMNVAPGTPEFIVDLMQTGFVSGVLTVFEMMKETPPDQLIWLAERTVVEAAQMHEGVMQRAANRQPPKS